MKKVDANELIVTNDLLKCFYQVNSIIENAKRDEAAAVGKDLIDTSSQSDDVTIKSVKSLTFSIILRMKMIIVITIFW